MRPAFACAVALASVACTSGRVTSGTRTTNAPMQAAILRREQAFGPEPIGIVQTQNPPTGTVIALGRGEVTRPRQQDLPVPVATPTGTPAPGSSPLDGGVDYPDDAALDAGGDASTGLPATP